uniref:Uncharacterized protein n=1 Tax=Aegilops tauschii subsp. strangulata TaxID=200361 RepID=A0A453B703_AEGTS
DDGPGHVVRRARRRRQQGPRRLQRPPRLAPHPLARRPRRQRPGSPPPPRPAGLDIATFSFFSPRKSHRKSSYHALPHELAMQGLDPLTTAGLFAEARCVGEKKVNGEECFILKLSADPQTLKLRSEGPAEIIRHVLFGYFSQRTGLMVHIEDSHLTRIQPHSGGDAVYWETTISSCLEDYRAVEGIMIAHAGRSAVTLFRFGEAAMSHTKTRMEEAWSIEEVAFNVP